MHADGQWDSMIDYLLDDWNVLEEEVKNLRKADLAVLRLAVESIPSYMRGNGHFYLQHANFNYCNMLVVESANFTAIVGWDSSFTQPCSMGFGR
jgi:hypothetical protein